MKKIKIKNLSHLEFKNLPEKELVYILDNDIPFKVTNIVNLRNNFRYCLNTETLYEDDLKILLTNLENRLLNCLIKNHNRIVTIKEIEDIVWEKKEKMSIYTMRNTIKKIRDKSYYGIIKNRSGHGYIIDTLDKSI